MVSRVYIKRYDICGFFTLDCTKRGYEKLIHWLKWNHKLQVASQKSDFTQPPSGWCFLQSVFVLCFVVFLVSHVAHPHNLNVSHLHLHKLWSLPSFWRKTNHGYKLQNKNILSPGDIVLKMTINSQTHNFFLVTKKILFITSYGNTETLGVHFGILIIYSSRCELLEVILMMFLPVNVF